MSELPKMLLNDFSRMFLRNVAYRRKVSFCGSAPLPDNFFDILCPYNIRIVVGQLPRSNTKENVSVPYRYKFLI